MGETMNKVKELEVAAHWWASHLRERPEFNNGDDGHAAMASLLPHESVAEKTINAFESILYRTMEEEFFNNCWPVDKPGFPAGILNVDYSPCPALYNACEAAGIRINTNTFPVKTVMWIHPGHVKIAVGYRSPIETLWQGNPTLKENK